MPNRSGAPIQSLPTLDPSSVPHTGPQQGASKGGQGPSKGPASAFPTYSRVSSYRQPSSERPWLQDAQAQGGNPHTVVFGHSQLTTDMRLSHYGAALTVGHFSCGSVRRSKSYHRPRYHVPGPGQPCFSRYVVYIALRPGGPCSCNGSPRPVLANSLERRTVSSRQFSSYSMCRRHGVTLVGFTSPEPERVVCVKRVRASPADAVLLVRCISTVASWAGCFLRAEQSGAFRLRREQSSSVPVLRPFVCLHDRVTRQIRNSD